MKKLLILDANSIINRAFYGVRYLSSKDGTPTNAVYGFLNMLFKLIDEVQPDYICAAFDLKAPTFRHKQYTAYKAQRKPMPDGLKVQMPIAKDILRAMDIRILELEGFEADDIIGTVSKKCEENGVECLIATGDKDDLQLASDKTRVILTVTKSGVNETVYYDDKAVMEKYHVTPSEFIDVKALMGDPSDNIPGVAGVGEKTAISLIEKHKSIEYIYDHIDEIGLKGAMLEKMKNGRDMAFLSKQLATIVRNAPVDFNFEGCTFGGHVADCATDALYQLLRKYDLNSIIKRLSMRPAMTPQEKTDIFAGVEFITAKSALELADCVQKIQAEKTCACVLSFQNDRPYALGLFFGNIAVDAEAGQIGQEAFLRVLQELMADEEVEKIMFDSKEAMVKLAPLTAVRGVAYDAAIAAYLINPARQSYGIESLALEYLGADIAGDTGEKQVSLFEEESIDGGAAKQAVAVMKLYEITKQKIEKNGQHDLYYDIELPLIRVLADMQILGIKIDRSSLQEFGDTLSAQIDVLTRQIYDYAGGEFNINSPKQLGVVLFETLGLKAGKKTKTGYSTNADVLEKLKDAHPIIGLLMEYRQLTKLKSTYCDGLSAVINPDTGRIHSIFNQTVTVTGRISSTEPNMQNIPTRTALGRELRKMFVAEGDGMVLVDADYSQIELRVLAHIANDEAMIRAFREGADVHTVTAAQVLGIPPEQVTKEQRSSAKAVNFGIVYGIGEYSLSQDLKITVKEAKRYIESYLEKYHGVREYMRQIKEQAERDGYVKTMMNRIRYIPELKSTNHNVHAFGERVALNTPIQGTAADIIKLAMVRVHRRLAKESLRARLILQVHDELIIEAPEEEAQQVSAILKEEMENAVSLRVPLLADTSVGKSWYEAK